MVAPNGITLPDGRTLHGSRPTGGTTFINLVRSGRASNQLRWKPFADGEAITYTPDNSGIVIFSGEHDLPDSLDARKEYVIRGNASIQPAKNWAIVVPSIELVGLADVSNAEWIPPGTLYTPTFYVRPRAKIAVDTIEAAPLGYVLLIA